MQFWDCPNLYRHSLNGRYYGVKKIPGKRKERSFKTADRQVANRRLRGWLDNLFKDRFGGGADDPGSASHEVHQDISRQVGEHRENNGTSLRSSKARGIIDWPVERAVVASVLLARAVVQNQLSTLEGAKAPLITNPLDAPIGEPLVELRQLLRDSGLTPASAAQALVEMVSDAENDPLIGKLVHGALFFALEGASPLQRCATLAPHNNPNIGEPTGVLLPVTIGYFRPVMHKWARKLQILVPYGRSGRGLDDRCRKSKHPARLHTGRRGLDFPAVD